MMTQNKRYNCPFCPALGLRNDDLAFSVSWEKGKYHCFRCGTSGGVGSLPPNFKQPFILREDKKHEHLEIENMTPLADSAIGKLYLEQRGLDPGPLERSVFISGKKLVFPFYDSVGNITYYVARKMWGSGRRYDNMAAAIKDIYVPPGVILPARLVLIITEGIFDALSVWQWLKVPCIGLLGMNISSFKVRKILDHTYPETQIIILLDTGELRTAVTYLNELTPLRKWTMICQLEEGDPNEIGKEKLWKKLMPLVISAEERTSLSTS